MEFLGTITATTGIGKTNVSTAVPFTVPSNVSHLFLESDTDGVQFEVGAGSLFVTSAANGARLFDAKSANTTQGPYSAGFSPYNATVAIWNPTAGTANVRVFGQRGARV